MSGAACLFQPVPAETGDVLASIRRLIASDSAGAPRADAPRGAGSPFGRNSVPACTTSTGCARALGPPPPEEDRTRRAVPPAVAAYGIAAQAGPGSDPAPLRLNPEAMVVAADAASCPPECPQQPHGKAASPQDATPPEDAASGAAQTVADGSAAIGTPPATALTAVEGGQAPPVHHDEDGPPAGPDPEARDSGPHDLSSLSNKETTMQAYPTGVVSPLHAEPVMTGVTERGAHNMAHVAPAAPVHPAPVAEENPLRALLREVVREEFEAEMQRRLDDNLRGMIRGEIVVALTEALVRRPA